MLITRLKKKETIDLEALVPLDRIREHCHADDTYTVYDGVLMDYRDAALEKAEIFTGRLWTGLSEYQQGLKLPNIISRREITFDLNFEPRNDRVFLYGPEGAMEVSCEDSKITLPSSWFLNGGNCCPQKCRQTNTHPHLYYEVGVSCASEVPRIVVQAVKQHIAWMLENPGGELVTMLDKQSLSKQGLFGTNDGFAGSGAMSLLQSVKRKRSL